jgi:hypothetical protein
VAVVKEKKKKRIRGRISQPKKLFPKGFFGWLPS